MPHAEHDFVGPHLDDDRVLDLLLELPPGPELEEAGRHLASCRRCEDLLRRCGTLLERRRASLESATCRSVLPGLGVRCRRGTRSSRWGDLAARCEIGSRSLQLIVPQHGRQGCLDGQTWPESWFRFHGWPRRTG